MQLFFSYLAFASFSFNSLHVLLSIDEPFPSIIALGLLQLRFNSSQVHCIVNSMQLICYASARAAV